MNDAKRRSELLRAKFALLWIGGESINGLIEKLDHSSYFVRQDAAFLIQEICRRDRISLPNLARDRLAAVQAEPRQG
jgi:hypothetical protein